MVDINFDTTIFDESGKIIANPDLSKGYVYKVPRILRQSGSEVYGKLDKQVYHAYTDEELKNQNEDAKRKEAEKTISEASAMQAAALNALIAQSLSANLSDAQAVSVKLVLPEWILGTAYKLGVIVRYNNKLYRALQDSVAAVAQEPDKATSLWKNIEEANANGVYPWSQPLGATDAYAKGDRVTYNGKTYESAIAANVWAPDVYGWLEVESETKPTDPDPEKPTDPDKPAEEFPEWKQPTGAHDAYAKGAKVSHNGEHWQSIADANVWEPGVYGWTEVK